jgi:hypothetical protein
MESIATAKLEDGALVVVDSAPIIYFLEGHGSGRSSTGTPAARSRSP